MLRARFVRALLVLTCCIATTSPSLADTTAPAPTPTAAYAAVLRTINPHLALARSLVYAQTLLTQARKWGLDPSLIVALVTVESRWNSRAVSVDGAEGLGQLTPATARGLGVDPFSVHGSLRGTTTYLHRLLGVFHSAREPMREALAGYNLGPETVRRYGGVPPFASTHRYIASILHEWKIVRKRVVIPHSQARLIAQSADPIVNAEQQQAAYWGQ